MAACLKVKKVAKLFAFSKAINFEKISLRPMRLIKHKTVIKQSKKKNIFSGVAKEAAGRSKLHLPKKKEKLEAAICREEAFFFRFNFKIELYTKQLFKQCDPKYISILSLLHFIFIHFQSIQFLHRSS